jgi:ABC-type multidrug transport system fused ATPase/permease subunit
VDDQQLNLLHIPWWRKQIGYVGQEPVLFSGTIFENIAFGLPNTTYEQVEAAAKMANAHHFISEFPKGYHTYLGERGSQLR